MTAAERFWYVLQNIAFGAGYFAKLPIAKAIDEVDGTRNVKGWALFWYVVENIFLGAGYFAKVVAKRALEQRDAVRAAPPSIPEPKPSLFDPVPPTKIASSRRHPDEREFRSGL